MGYDSIKMIIGELKKQSGELGPDFSTSLLLLAVRLYRRVKTASKRGLCNHFSKHRTCNPLQEISLVRHAVRRRMTLISNQTIAQQKAKFFVGKIKNRVSLQPEPKGYCSIFFGELNSARGLTCNLALIC